MLLFDGVNPWAHGDTNMGAPQCPCSLGRVQRIDVRDNMQSSRGCLQVMKLQLKLYVQRQLANAIKTAKSRGAQTILFVLKQIVVKVRTCVAHALALLVSMLRDARGSALLFARQEYRCLHVIVNTRFACACEFYHGSCACTCLSVFILVFCYVHILEERVLFAAFCIHTCALAYTCTLTYVLSWMKSAKRTTAQGTPKLHACVTARVPMRAYRHSRALCAKCR